MSGSDSSIPSGASPLVSGEEGLSSDFEGLSSHVPTLASDLETSVDLETSLTSDEEKTLASPASPVSDVINYRSLLPLCFLQFCESWNSDSIFAYVGYLVVDFGPEGMTKDEAGLYAGLVAGGCFFGNFLSSYLWGYLSDRYGRKKLLISGAIGTLASVILVGKKKTCFFFLFSQMKTGFSRSIWWAVAARSLSGIMNGNLGIAKSLIGEISTSKTIAQSFSWLGIAWGLGTICGSLSGGLLAQPAMKKPEWFGNTLFETFPYLLPNLLSALMLLLGLIATFVFLKVRRKALLDFFVTLVVFKRSLSELQNPNHRALLRVCSS